MLIRITTVPYAVVLVMAMAITLVGGWLMLAHCVLAAPDSMARPDMVVTQDINIAEGQTVGKLLVVNGTATVRGHVTGWLTVINGNLAIAASAQLDNPVLVLGGHLYSELGAAIVTNLTVIPNHSPLILYLLHLLVAAAASFLIVGGLALWFLERWVAHSPTWQKLLSYIGALIKRKPWLPAFFGFGFTAFTMTLFVEIAEATLWQREMELLDNIVIWLVRYFANPTMDRWMIFITNLGYGWMLLIFLALVCIWQVYHHERAALGSLLMCLAGSAALNYLLKHLFERARPELFRVVDAAGYSFPSGHAMVSLCFYGMSAYLLSRRWRQFVWRLLIYGLAAILITAIGLSRIYLGVHYPTDVLAGYTAGMTWLVICISLHIWWARRS